ncbi:hypothetical protein FXN61_18575 [Lentzea sp. PSKA42]|uniref:Secreted protein n=1 Tax=Lentzea indica TaxID=2604800 RepID=A0ABX1FIR8_9PSEU|nr:hypothetical protein [Lentzea indica]NKE58707.1 hypothetical protein [Lentzea indica]
MSLHTFRKAGITLAAVVTAFAGVMVTGPSASATTALADCTARLNPQYWSWTAQCTAPHTVSIRTDRRWYWLHQPGVIYTTSGTNSRLVEPGTPWQGRNFDIPERMTVQLCLTAYQDSTVLIAPKTCYTRWP